MDIEQMKDELDELDKESQWYMFSLTLKKLLESNNKKFVIKLARTVIDSVDEKLSPQEMLGFIGLMGKQLLSIHPELESAFPRIGSKQVDYSC